MKETKFSARVDRNNEKKSFEMLEQHLLVFSLQMKSAAALEIAFINHLHIRDVSKLLAHTNAYSVVH